MTFQIGHWTFDNAANNRTFMTELAVLLHSRDINFDAQDRRIMCFPHIINICSQHVISKFINIELTNATKVTPVTLAPNNATRQSFYNAVSCDPIALGRNTVRVLRSSGQRQDTFDDIIKDGNDKGWFSKTGNPPVNIQLCPLQLLQDVKTRWDSVYFMIMRLHEMRPVSYQYFARVGFT